MLSVNALTKSFGALKALDGVSFQVPDGKIVGFLGPNGAGKTTTMRCIFGLAEPDSGTIEWNGAPVDRRVRLQFGYMPEERGLYPKMKVGPQLSYLGHLSGMSKSDASEATTKWLTTLGLADRTDSTLEKLSHGNQQRVQLVAAMIHDPALAVLDEPFAGLDPIGVSTMSEVLRSIANRGTSVLFSSHQLDLVEEVCDDVVIINQGKLVLAGNVHTLRYESPLRHVEVSVNGEPWVTELEGSIKPAGNGGSRYVVDSSQTSLDDVLNQARSHGTITSVVFEPPTLSDLFREAVTR